MREREPENNHSNGERIRGYFLPGMNRYSRMEREEIESARHNPRRAVGVTSGILTLVTGLAGLDFSLLLDKDKHTIGTIGTILTLGTLGAMFLLGRTSVRIINSAIEGMKSRRNPPHQ